MRKNHFDLQMYPTKGVDTVATISELRAKTSEVLAHVRDQKEAVLIQRNNDPFAVLLDWQTYEQLMAHRTDHEADVDSSE